MVAEIGDVLGPVIGLFVGGGGVGSAWYAHRLKTNDESRRRVTAKLEALQDRLGEWRAACVDRATEPGAGPTDHDLATARHQFEVARDRCLDEDIRQVGTTYVQIAESFASGDPAVGVQAEQEAYNDLMDTIFRKLQDCQRGG